MIVYRIVRINGRAINRNRFLCIMFFLCISILILVYWRHTKRVVKQVEDEVVNWVPRNTGTSCHVSRKDDALSLLRKNATLPEKSIFFHETTCKGGLTSRQACAVESAARAHPRHQINVLFTSAVSQETLDDDILRTLLLNYKNVKLARVRISSYVLGTPIEKLVLKMPEELLNVHISKIMRYVSLYKYSGVYLGLDVIVAGSFDELWKNWAIRDTPMSLTHDMFSFSKNPAGRKLAEIAMGFLQGELSLNRQHDFWSYSGPNVLTHVLEHWCTTQKIELMKLDTCPDLAVYGPEHFVPISFHDRQKYFNTADWNVWKEKKMYTYLIWERFTKYNIIPNFSLYGKIANEYCPRIFGRSSDNLGVWYPLL